MKKMFFIALLAFAFTYLAAADKSAAPVAVVAAASEQESNSQPKTLQDYIDPIYTPAHMRSHMRAFISNNLPVLDQDTEDEGSESEDDLEVLTLTRTSRSQTLPLSQSTEGSPSSVSQPIRIPQSPRNPSPVAQRNEMFLRSLELAIKIQNRRSPIQI